MKRHADPGRRIAGWIACIAAIAAIAYVSADILLGTQHVLHSDSSIKSVLAKMALEQGRILPTGWTFANGDILTMTPYLFALPLTWLMGFGLVSNAWSTWLAYLAMLAATWYLLRHLRPADATDNAGDWTVLAMVASMLSVAAYEFVVRQGAYTVYAAALMPLLAMLFSRQGNGRATLSFLIGLLLASSNPMRGTVMIFAPLLLAIVADGVFPSRATAWGERWGLLRSRTLWSAMAGGFAGTLVYYYWLLPGLDNYDAAANISGPTTATVQAALTTILPDAVHYSTAGQSWDVVGKGQRLLQLFVWSIWLASLAVPGLVILRRSSPPRIRLLAWLSYAMLAAGVLPLLVTQGLYTSHSEFRYASLAMLLAWVVLGLSLARGHLLPRGASNVALIAISVTAMVTAMSWSNYRTTRNPTYNGLSANSAELIAAMGQDQVGTAAASYWNSHVISVLSGGRVMVNPIAYGPLRLEPFPHHVPRVPLSGYGGRRHAVILTKDEIASDGGRLLEWQLGKPWKRHDFGVYTVLVFDEPVVDNIYGVGARFDAPVAAETVELGLSELQLQPCHAEVPCMLTLGVENLGDVTISSAGVLPLRIGLQGLAADGSVLQNDLGRMDFPRPLHPGDRAELEAELPPMADEVVSIRPCLLQESVAWLCERTQISQQPASISQQKE